MTAIQAIFIRGYEERSSPKAHTVYNIDIQASVRSWQMWRRYSEFDDLHSELCKSFGPPPAPLPPKHTFSILRSHSDPKLLEERKVGLEAYLRAILSAKDDKWRESHAFKEFLGVPLTRAGAALASAGPSALPRHFTPASWLDEHSELQARLRDVWADINKRDALSGQGDVSSAHKSNVAAKAKLAGVLSRIGTLGKGLQELGMAGMNEGEIQRRTDMVARLQDDCERLGKVVSVARQPSRIPGGGGVLGKVPASETSREALLGAQTAKPPRRVFGAPLQETEATRPLDDAGLLGTQQVQIQEQDDQLDQLTTILRRQRQLGEAINNEIVQQIEMLDDLNSEVDRVGGKMQNAQRTMKRL